MAVNRRTSSKRNRIAPMRVITLQGSEEEVEGEGESVVPLMHHAASTGNTRQLVHEVQQDPSLLEQPNADGVTPLGQAVLSQQMAAVKRLVKMGANINAQDGLGRTCLSIAAYQGWLEGVVYLLRNGARQNIGDKTGRLPLHAATYHTDHRTLVTLLQSSTSADINQPDHEEMTALHWAAFHKRPEHVRCLMERGACLLLPDMDGKVPLHWAAQNGCVETCRLLLQGPGQKEGEEGEREGDRRAEGEKVKMLTAQDHSGKTALHFAAAAGHADVISYLTSYPSCQPNAQDPDDRTPLHWAAAMGHVQCVQTLIDFGVKVNVTDADGGTPLSYALQSSQDCVRLLEQALNLPATDSERVKSQGGGGGVTMSRKGKNPLGFLKGLFHSNRKNTTGVNTPAISLPTHTPRQKPSGHINGPQSCGSRSEANSERVSLPSISNRQASSTACGTASDMGGSSPSSLPVTAVNRQNNIVAGKSPETESRDDSKALSSRGDKDVSYRATNIPALPPLLPNLDRESTTLRDSTSRVGDGSSLQSLPQPRSPRDLGPLRGGPPPRAEPRQLSGRAAGRMHDGMLFQRSYTDLSHGNSSRTYPGMKGRKRGQHHSRLQLTSQQPQMTSGDVAGPIHPSVTSHRHLQSILTASTVLSHMAQSSSVTQIQSPGSSVKTGEDVHRGTSGSPLPEQTSTLSCHSSGMGLPGRERKPLINRKSDLKLIDI